LSDARAFFLFLHFKLSGVRIPVGETETVFEALLKKPAWLSDAISGQVRRHSGRGLGRVTVERYRQMPTGPTSVLIVDDEPAICELIRDELVHHGYDCWTVTNSRQAKELLAIQRFNVLIADISMLEITGLDLLAYVKQHVPDCRVILITGTSGSEHLAQALMLGADDYVQKPFSPAELGGIVSEILRPDADVPNLSVRAAEAIQMSSRAQQASLESVRALACAVEAKDPYTRRHSEHVTHYAVHLARAMGLDEATVARIRIASLLHDVGKIGVPDHILTKPGVLTANEFEFIRRHPALGADIVANITLFDAEAKLIRHHHECWDGQGYPDGLAGEDIPLGSRIMQIADSIDAMLMERTYKQGYSLSKTLDELTRCAGSQFDPDIAPVAVQWCRTNTDKLVLPNRPLEAVCAA